MNENCFEFGSFAGIQINELDPHGPVLLNPNHFCLPLKGQVLSGDIESDADQTIRQERIVNTDKGSAKTKVFHDAFGSPEIFPNFHFNMGSLPGVITTLGARVPAIDETSLFSHSHPWIPVKLKGCCWRPFNRSPVKTEIMPRPKDEN